MAHTGIFATSDEILVKAGKDYPGVTDITEARINALCLQAESRINVESRYNWSDAYAALNADVKGLLSEAESDLVAIYIVTFNLNTYPSRLDAETRLDVLWAAYDKCIALLKKNKKGRFIQDA